MIQLYWLQLYCYNNAKHCAEFRNAKCRQYVNQIIVTDQNETNSLSFIQRNLRHIWGHDALPSPHPTFWGTCPPVPRGIYATACY